MFRSISALCAVLAALAISLPTVVADSGFGELKGEYVVVSVRRNSFVASTASPLPADEDSPIGKTMEFTADGIIVEGVSCDAWKADSIETPVDFADDPMLSDLRLPPVDDPHSAGDKRSARSYRVMCEGEEFTTVYQADNRVLALSWANSTLYLVLERRLHFQQIRKMQLALKSLKFFSGQASGKFDEATANAVRAWYGHRQTDHDAAIPKRPAITENLLDGLKVLH